VPVFARRRVRSNTTPQVPTPRRASYGRVLRTPGAAAFYFGATPGRVGTAMTSLGIVWMIHWSTGSFGSAGIVTGGFAIAEGCIGPQTARLIDRYGQIRVLPFSLGAHAAAVGVLIALAATHSPLYLLAVAGVVAGAFIPQLGALTSARWAALLPGSPFLPTAFSLEALSNDVAYFAGPTLVGTISATVHPLAGSAVAAVLVTGGGGALIAQPRTAPAATCRQKRGRSTASLKNRRFTVLLAVSIGVGLFFGALQVSVTGFAVQHGAADVAGPLYSVASVASMLAGLTFGVRRWHSPLAKQLQRTLTLLAIGCIPLLFANTVPALAAALVIPGLAIAPTLIVSGLITVELVNPAVLTQAFTWRNSASAAGTALAAALAGHLLDTYGTSWSFAITVVATSSIAALVSLSQKRIRASPALMPPGQDSQLPSTSV
jgi:MFS family permease